VEEAGANEATFDGTSLASGVYVYRLMAGDVVPDSKAGSGEVRARQQGGPAGSRASDVSEQPKGHDNEKVPVSFSPAAAVVMALSGCTDNTARSSARMTCRVGRQAPR